MAMAYFPMFVDIKKKKCLIVGGGTVALRKVQVLLDFGADVVVVAPEVISKIKEYPVTVYQRNFEKEDLQGCELVVAATDDAGLNHEIAEAAQKQKIPVNAVDQQEDCSFIFPSYVLCPGTGTCRGFFQWRKQSGADTVPEEIYGADSDRGAGRGQCVSWKYPAGCERGTGHGSNAQKSIPAGFK